MKKKQKTRPYVYLATWHTSDMYLLYEESSHYMYELTVTMVNCERMFFAFYSNLDSLWKEKKQNKKQLETKVSKYWFRYNNLHSFWHTKAFCIWLRFVLKNWFQFKFVALLSGFYTIFMNSCRCQVLPRTDKYI